MWFFQRLKIALTLWTYAVLCFFQIAFKIMLLPILICSIVWKVGSNYRLRTKGVGCVCLLFSSFSPLHYMLVICHVCYYCSFSDCILHVCILSFAILNHHPNCTGTWTGTFWYETAQTRFILHNQCSQNWITLDDGTVIHVQLVYNCALTYASLKKVLNSAWWVYWHTLKLSMCTYSYKP